MAIWSWRIQLSLLDLQLGVALGDDSGGTIGQLIGLTAGSLNAEWGRNFIWQTVWATPTTV